MTARRWIDLTLRLLLLILLSLGLGAYHLNQAHEQLAEDAQRYEKALNASLDQYREIIALLLQPHLENTQTHQRLQDALSAHASGSAVARGLLYRQLHPLYEQFSFLGIEHFRLLRADGSLILDMDRPEQQGRALPREALVTVAEREGLFLNENSHSWRILAPVGLPGMESSWLEVGVPLSRLGQEISNAFAHARLAVSVPAGSAPAYCPHDGERQYCGESPTISPPAFRWSDNLLQNRGTGPTLGALNPLRGDEILTMRMPRTNHHEAVDLMLVRIAPGWLERLFESALFVLLAGGLLLGQWFAKSRRPPPRPHHERGHDASAEDSLRSITEAMGAGLYVQNSQGHITYVNHNALQLLRFSRKQLLGARAINAFHEPDRGVQKDELGRPICPIWQMTARGEEYHSDHDTFRLPDGGHIPVEIHAASLRSNKGAITGAVVVFNDISARRRAEMARQEAEKTALHNAKVRAELLANMSHEIRTPLNGVLGMISLALESKELSAENRDRLETAYDSGGTLLALLNSILDVSKLEAGKVELEHIDFDLRRTLETAVKLLASRALNKDLEINLLLPQDVPQWVNGDPIRLTQIVTNLIGNAIKFTEVGEIDIIAQADRLEGGQFRLTVQVRDTGIGIEPEMQMRIFDAFSQADSSTTRKFGGTGLGLALTKGLVDLFQGHLGLESQPGKGSTFWFRIPLAPPQQPHPQFAPAPELLGRQVLVLNGNATACRMLENHLKPWGLLLQCLANAQALRAFVNHQLERGPDLHLVIADENLGESALRECLALIDATPRLAGLPKALMHSRKNKAPAGFKALLDKPVTQSTLHIALCRLLDIHTDTEEEEHISGDLHYPHARVLVAEDNSVNQKLVRAILEPVIGQVDIVGDGRQAVAQTRKQPYDLILMDIQMPELDGISATRLIRDMESRQKRPPTPIVAVSAFASGADREECLDSGMNDFLGKPYRLDEMKDLLHRWLRQGEPRPATAKPPAPARTLPAGAERAQTTALLDGKALATLRQALGNDLDAVLEDFLQRLPEQLSALREAHAQQDEEGIRRIAHSLKGSAGNIGALALSRLGKSLQTGPAEDWPRHMADLDKTAEATIRELRKELEKVDA